MRKILNFHDCRFFHEPIYLLNFCKRTSSIDDDVVDNADDDDNFFFLMVGRRKWIKLYFQQGP